MLHLQQILQNNLAIFLLSLFVLAVFLLAWNLMLHLKISRIQKKIEIMFSGKEVSSLEELLINQSKSLKELDKDIQELFNISNQINRLASRGIHKIGMVRFNPFKDVGGDQSFAIALLNGKNSGITISSLYTREGTRVYSKSIIDGKADKHILTTEEQEAIEQAINNKPKKL